MSYVLIFVCDVTGFQQHSGKAESDCLIIATKVYGTMCYLHNDVAVSSNTPRLLGRDASSPLRKFMSSCGMLHEGLLQIYMFSKFLSVFERFFVFVAISLNVGFKHFENLPCHRRYLVNISA